MAKKNIISDFSALKGKVTFSEQSSVLAGPNGDADGKISERPIGQGCPKKQKDSFHKGEQIEENVLKVGQKVVLMDSDLRGRIVALGRTVKIELEDGLVIKAAYGEFAVTNEDEITALKQSKVKHKKTVTLSNASLSSKVILSRKTTHSKSGSNAIEVDLHIDALPGGRNIPKGQQLEYQMEIFRKIIRDNAHHRGRTITFIHGVGDGILKAAIRKELDEVLALRCSYSVGDPAITVVTIR